MELGTIPQYQDDSATPKKSPLTVGATEVAIKVPANAKMFIYEVRNAPMRITTTSGFGSGYNTILQGNGEAMRCQDLEYIYVKRDGSDDAELQFHFDVFV